MAALIANSAGNVCSNLCAIPCTLCKGCSTACNGLCKGCATACNGLCQGCSTACGGCCTLVTQVLCSPFAPYLILVALLNIPTALWGFRQVWPSTKDHNSETSCQRQDLWLWVNSAAAVLHVAVAIYVAMRVQNQGVATTKTTSPTTDDDKQAGQSISDSGRTRFRKVLCYDPLVAIYMLVGGAWMGWLAYGMILLIRNDDDCEDDTRVAIMSSTVCGVFFVVLSCCAIPCAFICLEG